MDCAARHCGIAADRVAGNEKSIMEKRAHGGLDYLQLPAHDLAASAAFYAEVFGWSTSAESGSFEAPDLFGQLILDRSPSTDSGPLLWLHARDLYTTLNAVPEYGGTVVRRPWLDGGERWLAEIDDPAGNRIGIVVGVTAPKPQTMIRSATWRHRAAGTSRCSGSAAVTAAPSTNGFLPTARS
jgi:predicted enzyme related to lactoylglutathione lyase